MSVAFEESGVSLEWSEEVFGFKGGGRRGRGPDRRTRGRVWWFSES